MISKAWFRPQLLSLAAAKLGLGTATSRPQYLFIILSILRVFVFRPGATIEKSSQRPLGPYREIPTA